MVTFAQGVLRLFRAGVRIDPGADAAAWPYPADADTDPIADRPADSFAVRLIDEDEAAESAAAEAPHLAPGFADIEAAVALVESGLATRIVLANFPSWPGLLWRAYELAEASHVQILPTVVRPGGRVDIAITRDPATDV